MTYLQWVFFPLNIITYVVFYIIKIPIDVILLGA